MGKLALPKRKKQPLEEFDLSDVERLRLPMLVLEDLIPNEWNPNVMSDDIYEKTKLGIQELIDESGIEAVIGIVVRPHPKKKDKWQIIDGEHRAKMLQELGYEKGPCHIVRCSDKRAVLLTEQLNHNRGTNDPKKYASYLYTLVDDHQESLDSLEEQLPQTAEDMETIMRAQNIQLDDVMIHGSPEDAEDQEGEEDDIEDLSWVDLKFRVAPDQAEVIETEIARLSSVLDGKNLRGRALEFMAVSSSQTPLESIVPKKRPKKKKRKE